MKKFNKFLALTAAIAVTACSGVNIAANASSTTTVAVEDSFNDVKYENSYDDKKWTVTTSDPKNPSIKQAGAQNTCVHIDKTAKVMLLCLQGMDVPYVRDSFSEMDIENNKFREYIQDFILYGISAKSPASHGIDNK